MDAMHDFAPRSFGAEGVEAKFLGLKKQQTPPSVMKTFGLLETGVDCLETHVRPLHDQHS